MMAITVAISISLPTSAFCGFSCFLWLLPECVCQVVEVDVLRVAVDPGGDNTEPVERALVTWKLSNLNGAAQFSERCTQRAWLATSRRRVFERPVVRFAIGQDV